MQAPVEPVLVFKIRHVTDVLENLKAAIRHEGLQRLPIL
jgi:hypothetical protein